MVSDMGSASDTITTMERSPRYPVKTLALIQTAATESGTLVQDSRGQYAVLHGEVLSVLYRTDNTHYAVLCTSNLSTGLYYENYRKAVEGFEWLVLDSDGQ